MAVWIGVELVARIPKEERMMFDDLGEGYREYLRHIGRPLPSSRAR